MSNNLHVIQFSIKSCQLSKVNAQLYIEMFRKSDV